MDLSIEGGRIHAATGGRSFDPDIPTIIFIHGSGLDHTVWALPARYFAHRDKSVLAVDLPGHGRSEGAPLASIEAMADWIVKLMDELDLSRASLVGHSMGALAALDCAGRYPDRVRAVALLGAAPKMPVHPDLLAAAEADDPLAFELMTSWGHGPSGHFGGARMPGTWMMGGGERLLERVRPGVLHADLAACNAYQGAMAAAAQVASPLLVIMGSEDKMTPARAGAKLAAAIPDARQVTIPACGHMMLAEKPDESLDALKTIL